LGGFSKIFINVLLPESTLNSHRHSTSADHHTAPFHLLKKLPIPSQREQHLFSLSALSNTSNHTQLPPSFPPQLLNFSRDSQSTAAAHAQGESAAALPVSKSNWSASPFGPSRGVRPRGLAPPAFTRTEQPKPSRR
jgi:hypothetical protein